MSSDNPVFLYKDILHVRISDHKQCQVETGPGMCRLTVSQGAFRNDGAAGYHSPAMAAIEETDAQWIFFDWWTGSWAENAFRFRIQTLIRKYPHMNGALFDEALGENGSIALGAGASGFAYDYYGNIPSCMLIRRDILGRLWGGVDSLFPYPIQKLSEAARKAGVQLEKIHEVILEKAPVREHLLVPAGHPNTIPGRKQEKKRLLVITHELSWTGAPLVLAEACIEVLKPAGYEIMVLSPKEGPATKKYLDNGISVMTLPEIASPDSGLLYSLVRPYDAVIVNTIVPYASIQILNTLETPVLWWIHECELMYRGLEQHLPRQLKGHMHAYCVGQYALGVLNRYRPGYNAGSLIYGLRDSRPSGEGSCPGANGRFRFATVGSVVDIKGQDILAEAISLLSGDIREKCEFLFVGKTEDADILAAIQAAEANYPQNVRYIGSVPRDVLDGIYPDVDCIICPSRYDCMPTFVAEGMSYGKPAICSENTGMAPILRAEDAGFVYSGNDPRKLADAIAEYVSLSEDARRAYSHKARACFDKHFALEVFRRNLLQAMDTMMRPAAETE